MSGLGSAGASIAQGTVIDVSASGITEDAAIGPSFQGGPLINQAGDVMAVASRTYCARWLLRPTACGLPHMSRPPATKS